MKIGRTFEFDPRTETILNDPEATRAAKPEYRGEWEFPEAYLQE